MNSMRHLVRSEKPGLLVVLGLEDLFATIKTVRADMVTHVRLTTGLLNGQLRRYQKIM